MRDTHPHHCTPLPGLGSGAVSAAQTELAHSAPRPSGGLPARTLLDYFSSTMADPKAARSAGIGVQRIASSIFSK
jgi:hypothetical protein